MTIIGLCLVVLAEVILRAAAVIMFLLLCFPFLFSLPPLTGFDLARWQSQHL